MVPFSYCWTLIFPLLFGSLVAGRIDPGSRLFARENQAWFSDNGTFALGFAPAATSTNDDQFQLGIWFAQLPGDRTFVWTPHM